MTDDTIAGRQRIARVQIKALPEPNRTRPEDWRRRNG